MSEFELMTNNESRVRSKARRHGYAMRKSRRMPSLDNWGEYMLVDFNANFIVLGSRYDASLADIEAYLADEPRNEPEAVEEKPAAAA